MRLKDITHHHWLSVETSFLQCYPDQQKSIEGYRKVYEALQEIAPSDTPMQLEINLVEDDEADYHDVCGIQPGEMTSYAIEFRPWSEWLGMTVTEKTLASYTELDILAHCLFEMTFMGFDEETIQGEWDHIKAASDELENMSEQEKKEKLTSWEDFLRELETDDNED